MANLDPRELLGPEFMRDFERTVQEFNPAFREKGTEFTLGYMTTYQDDVGNVYGLVGNSLERVVPLTVTRWHPPVGVQRLVIALPPEDKKPAKALPLGAMSQAARDAARASAAMLGIDLSIEALPLTEWDSRDPLYHIATFTNLDARGDIRYERQKEGEKSERRVKFTTTINGKLAVCRHPRNSYRPPPVDVDVLCRVMKEDMSVVLLLPLHEFTGERAREMLARANQDSGGPSIATGIRAEVVRVRPRLSGSPFAGLGLADETSFERVRHACTDLRKVVFASREQAMADPMFQAMQASEHDGSWIEGGVWWQDEEYCADRKQYLVEARDEAIRIIRSRPAPERPEPSLEGKPKQKRRGRGGRRHGKGGEEQVQGDGANGGSQSPDETASSPPTEGSEGEGAKGDSPEAPPPEPIPVDVN